jgi:hypothetical protein
MFWRCSIFGFLSAGVLASDAAFPVTCRACAAGNTKSGSDLWITQCTLESCGYFVHYAHS